MAEHPRLEELRRRVLADPASIAFAALAEEYRRSGSYDEAIETCRTGLQRHPSYLSARVTLGRALIETAQYDEARAELELVLKTAPENLAAIRGLAEIHERLGDHADHALVAEAAHQSAAVPEPSIPVPAVPESPIADWLLPPKPVAAPPSAPPVSPAAVPSPLVGAVATPASSPVAVAPTPIALSAASAAPAPPVAESIAVAPPARAPIPIAAAASAPAAAAAGTTAPLIARTPIAVATPARSPDSADAVPVRPTASAAGPDPVVARLEDFLAAIQTARTSARDAR